MGLLIAEVLSIPTSGIYHTDIPAYAGKLTKDPGIEELAWKFISLFYGRMVKVFVLSDSYKEKLTTRGVAGEKICKFIKGIDTDFFRPGRNTEDVRKKWNLQEKPLLLFVGRVSREKELELLVEGFLRIKEKYPDAVLAMVGDGPYLKELQKEYGWRDDIILPGFIEGEELANWYNCADIFTFPSTTDTYGTVLLEAQASGLPAVVSDQGGPKEVIVDGETGIVTRGGNARSFTAGILSLLEDKELKRKMADRARSHVKNKSWQNAFSSFVTENSKH
jgi:glycosyltransferase involved in cell wall biosynthesis